MIERLAFFGVMLAFVAVPFGLGFMLGRLVREMRAPPLREPVRPAEAAVEYWTAEDVNAFRSRTPEDLSWMGADDS